MCYGYCVVDSTVEGNVDEVVVDYAAADCVAVPNAVLGWLRWSVTGIMT
jgi:hypothetical protein